MAIFVHVYHFFYYVYQFYIKYINNQTHDIYKLEEITPYAYFLKLVILYVYCLFYLYSKYLPMINRLHTMINNLFTIINQLYIFVSNLYTKINKLFTKKGIFVNCFKSG